MHMATIDIKVPDIGDFAEVAVIEVLVQPGDTIKAEQSLITVESDKASMEIPSSHAGVVKELRVKLGDKIAEGSVVLTLEVEGATQRLPLRLRQPAVTSEPKQAPALAAQAQAAIKTEASSFAAVPIWSATCSCSAAAPAATAPPSARPTWASRSCWSSATPSWAACA
jgi:dihydrolipoamide dehydrogenase